jgi:hypothetical protein
MAGAILLLTLRQFSDQMNLEKFKSEDFKYVQDEMSCELMSIKRDRSQWRSCLDCTSTGPHLFVLGDSHATNLVPCLGRQDSVCGHLAPFQSDQSCPPGAFLPLPVHPFGPVQVCR